MSELTFSVVLSDMEDKIPYKDFINRVRNAAITLGKETVGPLSISVKLGKLVLVGEKSEIPRHQIEAERRKAKGPQFRLGIVCVGPLGKTGYYLKPRQTVRETDLHHDKARDAAWQVEYGLVGYQVPEDLLGSIFRPT